MEDLEFNPFYRSLQNQYQALFDRAQDECWLVCIPCASSLPPKSQITHSFAEAHLLEPSRMLRDEFQSLVGSKRFRWKLKDNSKLICSDSDIIVNILAEELAYNKKYNQYKMFVISAPLVEVDSRRRGGERGRLETGCGLSKQELLAPRRTTADHVELLQCFRKHDEILKELNKRLHMFNNNYMILEGFLTDASSTLETLLKNGYSSYIMEHPGDERVQDRRIMEAIWLAVESLIMNSVHSKVYPVICKKYSQEDKQFRELSQRLRLSSFTPASLNVPQDYHCKYPITLSTLGKLPNYTLPLEKLYCLQDSIDAIYKDVNEHFKSRLRIGDPSMLQSDDLIPLLATILVQANLKTFVTDVSYIELFHWSPSDSNKLSYVLVTVRASLEYIRGPEAQKYLPSKPTARSSEPNIASSLFSTSRGPPSPLTTSALHNDSSTELSQTLSKLANLRVKADELEKSQKPSSSHGLGPFFNSLEDGVVSSKQYYNQ